MKKIPNKFLRIIIDRKIYGSKITHNSFFLSIMANISSAIHFDNFYFKLININTFATSNDSWEYLYEK